MQINKRVHYMQYRINTSIEREGANNVNRFSRNKSVIKNKLYSLHTVLYVRCTNGNV